MQKPPSAGGRSAWGGQRHGPAHLNDLSSARSTGSHAGVAMDGLGAASQRSYGMHSAIGSQSSLPSNFTFDVNDPRVTPAQGNMDSWHGLAVITNLIV